MRIFKVNVLTNRYTRIRGKYIKTRIENKEGEHRGSPLHLVERDYLGHFVGTPSPAEIYAPSNETQRDRLAGNETPRAIECTLKQGLKTTERANPKDRHTVHPQGTRTGIRPYIRLKENIIGYFVGIPSPVEDGFPTAGGMTGWAWK